MSTRVKSRVPSNTELFNVDSGKSMVVVTFTCLPVTPLLSSATWKNLQ